MTNAPSSSSSPSPEEPAPQAAPSAGTVTEALAQLAGEGYGDDLRLDGTTLHCRVCHQDHPADIAEVERMFRFEGQSDPGDEMMVLGLRCPHCGVMGSLATAFGMDADPDLAEAFVYLAGRARHS